MLQREATYALLGELEGALVTANLEKLHDALLIRGVTGNLTDDLANELGASTEFLRRFDGISDPFKIRERNF